MNAQTGPEVGEQMSRKTLCKNVGILKFRGDMKNPNVSEANLFTNKVYIDLDMFGPLMLNRVI